MSSTGPVGDGGAGGLVTLSCCTSTNDVARRAATAGVAGGWAVRAECQGAGRGRRDHGWESPAGNLFLSVVLRPRVPLERLGALPALAGLALLAVLGPLVPTTSLRLKWPNDIVAVAGPEGPAKLAGVLVECGTAKAGCFAVAGIGVNVARAPALTGCEAERALPATSLTALACGAPLPSLDELARAIARRLVSDLARWEQALGAAGVGCAPLTPLLDKYTDACWLVGKPVLAHSTTGAVLASGRLAGFDGWGRALLETGGERVILTCEEASLRPDERARRSGGPDTTGADP